MGSTKQMVAEMGIDQETACLDTHHLFDTENGARIHASLGASNAMELVAGKNRTVC